MSVSSSPPQDASHRGEGIAVPVDAARAQTSGSGANLAAPPRDVRVLLARHGTSLPRYLDVDRLQQLEQGARRWPLLFGRYGPAGEIA